MTAPPAVAAAGIDDGSVFRSLFAAYPDALLVADAGGTIVLANPAAAEAARLRASTSWSACRSTRWCPTRIRPRHAAYREAYARATRARGRWARRWTWSRGASDGSEVMVEIALSPLQDHGLPLVVAAIRDIGAYPRVKQALQRARYSEHLAQLGRLAVDARDPQVLLEQVPADRRRGAAGRGGDGATCWSRTGSSSASPAASACCRGERVGERVAEPARHARRASCWRTAQPVLVRRLPQRAALRGAAAPTSRPGWSAGSRCRCPTAAASSARWRCARAAPQRFGDDEVRFLESLSNLLATSLQRAQTEEALNHAQRLESVGQLTGGIAHDFNNLLTVIQGNLQVLEELPALAERRHGAAAGRPRPRGPRRRGAELTSKLLAFSRRQVLQPSVGRRRRAAAVAGRHAAAHARPAHPHRGRRDAACPPVLADPGQLESALLNIAINARDAMPEGGTLRFRAAACAALPAEVRARSSTPAPRPTRLRRDRDRRHRHRHVRRGARSAPSSPSSRPRRPGAAPASA